SKSCGGVGLAPSEGATELPTLVVGRPLAVGYAVGPRSFRSCNRVVWRHAVSRSRSAARGGNSGVGFLDCCHRHWTGVVLHRSERLPAASLACETGPTAPKLRSPPARHWPRGGAANRAGAGRAARVGGALVRRSPVKVIEKERRGTQEGDPLRTQLHGTPRSSASRTARTVFVLAPQFLVHLTKLGFHFAKACFVCLIRR